MEKFQYLTSEDHAKWYVTYPCEGIELIALMFDENPGLRIYMRQWIEDNCIDRVYAWNKTRTPDVGEQNWGRMIMPHGDMVFHFENDSDRALFKLTWL